MRRWMVVGMAWIGLVMLLAACGKAEPEHKTAPGDELLRVSFDQPGEWEEGIYPADSADPTSTLTVGGGRYRIDHRAESSASFIWGTGGADYANVIIDLDAEQLSSATDTLYGAACRLDTSDPDNPTGYALLISGDGHYGIATLKNRSLTFLVEWHQSDAIHSGQAANHVRAICIDNYLALYVNDKFVGDITDRAYNRAGSVGLIAGANAGTSISAAFDNLVVAEGSIVEE